MASDKTGDMKGRVVLITGAAGGIGRATAKALAKLGADVVLGVRDAARAKDAIEEVTKAAAGGTVEALEMDLSSLASIRAGAERFLSKHDRLHVLINNAGVSPNARRLSRDGIEETFAVNVIAPYYLTTLLLPALKAGSPSRVVNVSSRLHERGKIDWADLQGANKWSAMRAYGNSKLALNLVTRAQANRLAGTGVTVNALHPGVIATDLIRDFPRPITFIAHLFMSSVDQGAHPSVVAASSPDLATTTGQYFHKTKPAAIFKAPHDDASAERLLMACEKIVSGVSASAA